MKLSRASNNIFGQPMFQVLSKIKEKERAGHNIIHFEIGDPDFDSPPSVIQAGCASLQAGFTHYADSMGDYDLRNAVRKHIKNTRGFLPDLSQVLITPGANPIIFYAAACVVNPGEDVIIPDPCFSSYISVLKFLGINIIRVPLLEKNGFRMQPSDVEAAITDKTRMIIINSPNNPTGAVMHQNELKGIAELSKKRHIFLYLDEIYLALNYSSTPSYSPSVLDECKEYSIIADGFSKAYAMTGWRLGYAVAPETLTRKMGLLLETTASCVPPFVQRAGIEAIEHAGDYMKEMVATYNRRRDVLVDGLNSIRGIRCIRPEGAFYVFANIQGTGRTSRDFAEAALEKCNVGLVAGNDFGSTGEGYVRLCYALSEDKIKEGVKRLEKISCD